MNNQWARRNFFLLQFYWMLTTTTFAIYPRIQNSASVMTWRGIACIRRDGKVFPDSRLRRAPRQSKIRRGSTRRWSCRTAARAPACISARSSTGPPWWSLEDSELDSHSTEKAPLQGWIKITFPGWENLGEKVAFSCLQCVKKSTIISTRIHTTW